MGRRGLDEGTRELIEYPYIIVYEVFEGRSEMVVWSIVHGAQHRERWSKKSLPSLVIYSAGSWACEPTSRCSTSSLR